MSYEEPRLPGMEVTPITPEQLRDDAIARVAKGAGDWVDRALSVVRAVCLERDEFTTDDVHRWARMASLEEPREPRAWGAVMRFSIGKVCVKTPRYIKSQRGPCHARPIPIYQSLIRHRWEAP